MKEMEFTVIDESSVGMETGTSMAPKGYARTSRPSHSRVDGDTIFALATGRIEADLSVVGLLAPRVMERAVVAAVKNAEPLCGLKCYANIR